MPNATLAQARIIKKCEVMAFEKKRVVSLIIVLVMLAFVVLYITKATNFGRQPSGLEIERQHSGNMSVQERNPPTLPVNANETNVTNADIAQEQLQANNQSDFSTGSKNITPPKVCISRWLQDTITVNETLRCINDYMKKTNGSE